VKRLLAAVLLAAVLHLSAAPALAATPNTGEHLHWEVTNHPVDGFPIPRAKYTFHVIAQTHEQVKATRWFRVDITGHTIGPVKLVLGPGDARVEFDYTIDFTGWSPGRYEFRWHLDLSPNEDGHRQFTTSRSQVCIGDCVSNKGGRATPFNGGGSWYDDGTGGKYATAYVLSRDTDVRPGGTLKVRAAQDARKICVLQNPDIHHGSSGTILGCWADTSTHTIALTNVAVGDKLLVLAIQPNGNAGVIRLIVGDGTPHATADYEYQSWWAKGGVVLP
jgi:hypothetical protein